MKIISDENGTNILLNDDEIEIFQDLLSDASGYQAEYGDNKSRDVSVRNMIEELFGKGKE